MTCKYIDNVDLWIFNFLKFKLHYSTSFLSFRDTNESNYSLYFYESNHLKSSWYDSNIYENMFASCDIKGRVPGRAGVRGWWSFHGPWHRRPKKINRAGASRGGIFSQGLGKMATTNKIKDLTVCLLISVKKSRGGCMVVGGRHSGAWVYKWLDGLSIELYLKTCFCFPKKSESMNLGMTGDKTLVPTILYLWLLLTTLNRYLSRCCSKDLILTASSENITITRCGVFLATFPILCFVTTHWIGWIQWKSFRKN